MYTLVFKNTKMLKMPKCPNLSLLNIYPRQGQRPFCLDFKWHQLFFNHSSSDLTVFFSHTIAIFKKLDNQVLRKVNRPVNKGEEGLNSHFMLIEPLEVDELLSNKNHIQGR